MFEMMYFIPFCCLLEFQCVDGDHTLYYIFHIHQVMDIWVVSTLGLFRFIVIMNGLYSFIAFFFVREKLC